MHYALCWRELALAPKGLYSHFSHAAESLHSTKCKWDQNLTSHLCLESRLVVFGVLPLSISFPSTFQDCLLITWFGFSSHLISQPVLMVIVYITDSNFQIVFKSRLMEAVGRLLILLLILSFQSIFAFFSQQALHVKLFSELFPACSWCYSQADQGIIQMSFLKVPLPCFD